MWVDIQHQESGRVPRLLSRGWDIAARAAHHRADERTITSMLVLARYALNQPGRALNWPHASGLTLSGLTFSELTLRGRAG